MPKRVCAEPGCPVLTDTTRCPEHTRSHDKARGTRQQRGYDAAHEAERAKWQRIIDARGYPCTSPTCTKPREWITAGQEWHLGHTDDRSGYHGPEHPACNLSAGGRARHGVGGVP